MEKTRKYRKTTVELCRNCGGRGYVTEDHFFEHEDGSSQKVGHTTCPCPVCDGRGRVWKVNEGSVKIEPFAGQTE